MAQLKSFKYIEGETNENPNHQVSLETQETVNNEASQQSEISNPSYSSQSISTLTGGNLTSGSTTSGPQEAQNQDENKENLTAKDGEEEEVITLSSNEEYQVARHDIGEEEDEEESGGSATKIDVETQAKQAVSEKTRARQQAGAPITPRVQSIIHQEQAASPRLEGLYNRQSPRPMSPGRTRYEAPTGAGSGDNISQYSMRQISSISNQFEIQWRNINLMARKSKVPKIIEDNPIYKFFKSKNNVDDDNKAEKIYYSPPVQHKIFNMHPTISEHVELDSKLSNTDQQPVENSNGFKSLTNALNGTSNNNDSEFRTVLSNISGSVFSGQLTAILGPSGVGKTMLLNSLTGRNTLDGTGRVSLLYGGKSKRMSVVTVPQADVLPEKLSTLEDLQFTSRLKNTQKGFDHERNISRLVKHLQMEKFLHTRIDKLSGGEARRLSICRELLSSPDIMILDEPTSGLDANTCKKIITALRDIVEHSDNILDRPMSIIVTIHQPQQEVLNLFHRVYVIALGGRAIYEGPPSGILPSLLEQSSLSKVCKVDQLNENPAIVALEVASGEYGPNIINELAMHHENQVCEESLYAGDNSPYLTPKSIRQPRKSPMSVSPRFELLRRARINSIDSISIGRPTPVVGRRQVKQADQLSTVTSLSYASTFDADLPEQVSRLKVDKRLRRSVVMKSDFISHTCTLIERSWLLTTRDLFLMSIRILGFLLVAGGMVQIFRHALDPDEHQCPTYESNVDDMISFMGATKERLLNLSSTLKQASSTHLFFFHLVLCVIMVTSALSGLVFPLQMRMFLREYKNGWYSPASFITSQTLADLPVDILGPTICCLIVYPLCHQPSSPYYWREVGYILIMIVSSIICKSQAQIVGAFLMDSVENSVFISCVMVTVPALLSGIAVRIREMTLPLQWLSYASFLRYAFESLFLLRYGYGICPCDDELVHGYPLTMTQNSMPTQLERLAEGFLELGSPQNTSLSAPTFYNTTSAEVEPLQANPGHTNVFLKFLQLVTEASNMFVPRPEQLGNCTSYRSLYLMDMDIKDNYLPKWFSIMLFMFILSRFLTYFCVKLMIKLRRNKKV